MGQWREIATFGPRRAPSYNGRMDDRDQAERAEHDMIAGRIEDGVATPADLARVMAMLDGTGRRRDASPPRLDSADDFEAWVVRPGYDGLNELHVDETGENHVVGFYHEDRGQGRGRARRIGAAMWAAYVRATGCPDIHHEEPDDPDAPRVLVVRHRYQIGDLSVPVEVPAGFDAARTAAFIQLACEEWHDEGAVLLPQDVVEALIRFYGCRPAPMPGRIRTEDEIDLYWEREEFCGDHLALMADAAIAREGLREFLKDRYES